MKRTEIELPESLYADMEGAAERRHISISEFLLQSIERAVADEPLMPSREEEWQYPAPQPLGTILAPPEDLRLLANEPGTD